MDPKRNGLKGLLVTGFCFIAILLSNQPLKLFLRRMQEQGLDEAVGRVIREGNLQALNLSTGLEFFFLFFPFFMVLAALILGFGVFMNRPVNELIRLTGGPRWKKMLQAGLIWLILQGATDLLLSRFLPGAYRLDFQWKPWLIMNAWLLLYVPVQTAAEEFFFRGFLMDMLGGWHKGRWIALWLPALIFTLLHVPNPELKKYGIALMLPQYLAMALFLGYLSYRDQGLEAAWGVHIANNWYGIALVNLQGSSIPSDSAFTLVDYRPLLGGITMLFSMLIFLSVQSRMEKRQPHQS